MTVHLVSVGVNLLDAFTDPGAFDAAMVDHCQPGRVVCDRVDGDATAASALLHQWFPPSGAPDADQVTLRDALRLDEVRPELWQASVSAELDTFQRAAKQRYLSRDDIALLLASDTVDGLTAAMWNAIALVRGDLTRVRYLPEAHAPLPDLRGTATIVRIPGMDADNEKGFRRAMGALGILGRALIPITYGAEDFRCYLSGGFKAAVPYLIGLAEGLRSLPEIQGSVDAYVLHERTSGAPIRLPLRRVAPEWVRRELAGFNAAGERPTAPDEDFLEGYAYEIDVDGGRCRLTAFGVGLRHLFGLAPEDLGR